jgi:hypothetical protein
MMYSFAWIDSRAGGANASCETGIHPVIGGAIRTFSWLAKCAMFSVLFFPVTASALPLAAVTDHVATLTHGSAKRVFLGVDNSQDAWSDLVAGLAPLVLLVGERVTKQHLRECRSRVDYYMLGATPFGLATSIVNMLRLISVPVIARLIGRSDELVRDACKEITPVNTGDANSVLEAGKVQRGDSEISGSLSRLHVWEFSTTISALQTGVEEIRESMQSMTSAYRDAVGVVPTHSALIVAEFIDASDPVSAAEYVESLCISKKLGKSEDARVQGTLSAKVTAVGNEVNYRDGQVRSRSTNWLLVISSVSVIVALHVASLADRGWEVSLG